MAQLAIQGHVTRGSEVIALLEMLGGKNIYNLTGTKEIWYILSNGTIKHSAYLSDEKGFTLEEFLEKFPYKVGDKVTLDKFPCTIKGMSWDCDDVIYYVQGVDFSKGIYSKDKDLQPYKEETMETITIDDFKANTKEWLIDRLHGMIISEAIKTIVNIHDELHKPQYPKTYEECCDVIGLHQLELPIALGYKAEIIETLQQLLICRDAYWMIYGEENGLGKPWEPTMETVYCISRNNNVMKCSYRGGKSNILEFPTAEMRDAFYENFKELIESCKELL